MTVKTTENPAVPPGRPVVPSSPGPFTFRCILTAKGPTELEELAKIFTDHGQEVIKEGAAAFELKASVDKKYLQIEEVSKPCLLWSVRALGILLSGENNTDEVLISRHMMD